MASNEFELPFERSRRAKKLNQQEEKALGRSLGSRALGRAIDRPRIGKGKKRRRGDIDIPTGGIPGNREPTGSNFDPDRDGWVDEGTTRPRFIGVPGAEAPAAQRRDRSEPGLASGEVRMLSDEEARSDSLVRDFLSKLVMPRPPKKPVRKGTSKRNLSQAEIGARWAESPIKFGLHIDDDGKWTHFVFVANRDGNQVNVYELSDIYNTINSLGLQNVPVEALSTNANAGLFGESGKLVGRLPNISSAVLFGTRTGDGVTIVNQYTQPRHTDKDLVGLAKNVFKEIWPELNLEDKSQAGDLLSERQRPNLVMRSVRKSIYDDLGATDPERLIAHRNAKYKYGDISLLDGKPLMANRRDWLRGLTSEQIAEILVPQTQQDLLKMSLDNAVIDISLRTGLSEKWILENLGDNIIKDIARFFTKSHKPEEQDKTYNKTLHTPEARKIMVDAVTKALNDSPGLKWAMEKFGSPPISALNERYLKLFQEGTAGLYMQSIGIGIRPSYFDPSYPRKDVDLTLRPDNLTFIVDPSWAGTLAHEWAHWFHYRAADPQSRSLIGRDAFLFESDHFTSSKDREIAISGARTLLTSDDDNAKAIIALSDRKRQNRTPIDEPETVKSQWLPRIISIYAHKNGREMFAEAVTAILSANPETEKRAIDEQFATTLRQLLGVPLARGDRSVWTAHRQSEQKFDETHRPKQPSLGLASGEDVARRQEQARRLAGPGIDDESFKSIARSQNARRIAKNIDKFDLANAIRYYSTDDNSRAILEEMFNELAEPIGRDSQVYLPIVGIGRGEERIKVGDVIHRSSFSSTVTDKGLAVGLSDGVNSDFDSTIMSINVPGKTRVLLGSGGAVDSKNGENEVILDRGTQLEVSSIKRKRSRDGATGEIISEWNEIEARVVGKTNNLPKTRRTPDSAVAEQGLSSGGYYPPGEGPNDPLMAELEEWIAEYTTEGAQEFRATRKAMRAAQGTVDIEDLSQEEFDALKARNAELRALGKLELELHFKEIGSGPIPGTDDEFAYVVHSGAPELEGGVLDPAFSKGSLVPSGSSAAGDTKDNNRSIARILRMTLRDEKRHNASIASMDDVVDGKSSVATITSETILRAIIPVTGSGSRMSADYPRHKSIIDEFKQNSGGVGGQGSVVIDFSALSDADRDEFIERYKIQRKYNLPSPRVPIYQRMLDVITRPDNVEVRASDGAQGFEDGLFLSTAPAHGGVYQGYLGRVAWNNQFTGNKTTLQKPELATDVQASTGGRGTFYVFRGVKDLTIDTGGVLSGPGEQALLGVNKPLAGISGLRDIRIDSGVGRLDTQGIAPGISRKIGDIDLAWTEKIIKEDAARIKAGLVPKGEIYGPTVAERGLASGDRSTNPEEVRTRLVNAVQEVRVRRDREREEAVQEAEDKLSRMQSAMRKFEQTGQWDGAEFGVDEITGTPEEIRTTAEAAVTRARREAELERYKRDTALLRRQHGTIDVEDIPEEIKEVLEAETKFIRTAGGKYELDPQYDMPIQRGGEPGTLNLDEYSQEVNDMFYRSPIDGRTVAVHQGPGLLEGGKVDPKKTIGEVTGDSRGNTRNINFSTATGWEEKNVTKAKQDIETEDALRNFAESDADELVLTSNIANYIQFGIPEIRQNIGDIQARINNGERVTVKRSDFPSGFLSRLRSTEFAEKLEARKRDLARAERIVAAFKDNDYNYSSAYANTLDASRPRGGVDGYFGRHTGLIVPKEIAEYDPDYIVQGQGTPGKGTRIYDPEMEARWRNEAIRAGVFLVDGEEGSEILSSSIMGKNETAILRPLAPVIGISIPTRMPGENRNRANSAPKTEDLRELHRVSAAINARALRQLQRDGRVDMDTVLTDPTLAPDGMPSVAERGLASGDRSANPQVTRARLLNAVQEVRVRRDREREEAVQEAEDKLSRVQSAMRRFEETGKWDGAEFGIDEITGTPEEIRTAAEAAVTRARREVDLERYIRDTAQKRREQGTIDIEDIPDEVRDVLAAETTYMESVIPVVKPTDQLDTASPKRQEEQRRFNVREGRTAVIHQGPDTLDGGVIDPKKTMGDPKGRSTSSNTALINRSTSFTSVFEPLERSKNEVERLRRFSDFVNSDSDELEITSEHEIRGIVNFIDPDSTVNGVPGYDVGRDWKLVEKFKAGERIVIKRDQLKPAFFSQHREVDDVIEKLRKEIEVLQKRADLLEQNDSNYVSAYRSLMEGARPGMGATYIARHRGRVTPSEIAEYPPDYQKGVAPVIKDPFMAKQWRERAARGTAYLVEGEMREDFATGLMDANEISILKPMKPLIGLSTPTRGVDEEFAANSKLSEPDAQKFRAISPAIFARALKQLQRDGRIDIDTVLTDPSLGPDVSTGRGLASGAALVTRGLTDLEKIDGDTRKRRIPDSWFKNPYMKELSNKRYPNSYLRWDERTRTWKPQTGTLPDNPSLSDLYLDSEDISRAYLDRSFWHPALVDPKSEVGNVMNIWRSDFSTSRAMARALAGLDLPSAYDNERTRRMVEVLRDALENAPELDFATYRTAYLTPDIGTSVNIGDELTFNAAAVATSVSDAASYDVDVMTGAGITRKSSKFMFVFPLDARGVFYDDDGLRLGGQQYASTNRGSRGSIPNSGPVEGIVSGKFRVARVEQREYTDPLSNKPTTRDFVILERADRQDAGLASGQNVAGRRDGRYAQRRRGKPVGRGLASGDRESKEIKIDDSGMTYPKLFKTSVTMTSITPEDRSGKTLVPDGMVLTEEGKKSLRKLESRQAVEVEVHEIGGERIVFGIPEHIGMPKDAKIIRRQITELTGIPTGSDEAYRVSLRYMAAMHAHRMLNTRGEFYIGRAEEGSSYVDALLYAASRGDADAQKQFDALADHGEKLLKKDKTRYIQDYSNSDESIERIVESYPEERREEKRTELIKEREETRRQLEMVKEDEGLTGATTDDLYVVHETAYDVQYDEEGNLLLYPNGHWTNTPGSNYPFHRHTVHFALNHVAAPHAGRTGSKARFAIVAPLKTIAERNPGSVENVYPVDTYLVPRPGQPLVIPKGTFHVVEYKDVTEGLDPETGEKGEMLSKREFAELASRIGMKQPKYTSDKEASPGFSSIARQAAVELGATYDLHANLALRAEQLLEGVALTASNEDGVEKIVYAETKSMEIGQVFWAPYLSENALAHALHYGRMGAAATNLDTSDMIRREEENSGSTTGFFSGYTKVTRNLASGGPPEGPGNRETTLEKPDESGVVIDDSGKKVKRRFPTRTVVTQQVGERSLKTIQDLIPAGQAITKETLEEYDFLKLQRNTQLIVPIHEIDGESIIFGDPQVIGLPDGVKVVRRNVQELSGIEPATPEGNELAYKFVVASYAFLSLNDGLDADPSPTRNTTYVDALLYSASRGNKEAQKEFDKLSEIGEKLIKDAKKEREKSTKDRINEQYDREKQDVLNSIAKFRAEGREDIALLEEKKLAVIESTRQNKLDEEDVSIRKEGLEDATIDSLWIFHETRYDARYDEDGNVILYPEGHYRGSQNSDTYRTTIHTTINHTAIPHHMRDETSHTRTLIAVPLRAVLEANPDSLDNLYAVDTYFTPAPGKPLVLPKDSVKVVRYEDEKEITINEDVLGPDGKQVIDETGTVVQRQKTVITRSKIERTALIAELIKLGMKQPANWKDKETTEGFDAVVGRLAKSFGVTSAIHDNLSSRLIEITTGGPSGSPKAAVLTRDSAGTGTIQAPYIEYRSLEDVLNYIKDISKNAIAQIGHSGRYNSPMQRVETEEMGLPSGAIDEPIMPSQFDGALTRADISGLDPELQEYAEMEPSLGTAMIRHPLLFWPSPIFDPVQLNNILRAKTEQRNRARAEKNWSRYIYLHERPYRLEAFEDIEELLSDKEYWELLADIWVDTENQWQNVEAFERLLSSDRSRRELMMDDRERAQFSALPDKITIYRGFQNGKNRNGLSWTTDQDRAEWFANRRRGPKDTPGVISTTVDKKDVVAFFTRRGENEIVLASRPKRARRIEMRSSRPEFGLSSGQTGRTVGTATTARGRTDEILDASKRLGVDFDKHMERTAQDVDSSSRYELRLQLLREQLANFSSPFTDEWIKTRVDSGMTDLQILYDMVLDQPREFGKRTNSFAVRARLAQQIARVRGDLDRVNEIEKVLDELAIMTPEEFRRRTKEIQANSDNPFDTRPVVLAHSPMEVLSLGRYETVHDGRKTMSGQTLSSEALRMDAERVWLGLPRDMGDGSLPPDVDPDELRAIRPASGLASTRAVVDERISRLKSIYGDDVEIQYPFAVGRHAALMLLQGSTDGYDGMAEHGGRNGHLYGSHRFILRPEVGERSLAIRSDAYDATGNGMRLTDMGRNTNASIFFDPLSIVYSDITGDKQSMLAPAHMYQTRYTELMILGRFENPDVLALISSPGEIAKGSPNYPPRGTASDRFLNPSRSLTLLIASAATRDALRQRGIDAVIESHWFDLDEVEPFNPKMTRTWVQRQIDSGKWKDVNPGDVIVDDKTTPYEALLRYERRNAINGTTSSSLVFHHPNNDTDGNTEKNRSNLVSMIDTELTRLGRPTDGRATIKPGSGLSSGAIQRRVGLSSGDSTVRRPSYPRTPTLGAFVGGAEDVFGGARTWDEFWRIYRGRDIIVLDYETTGLVFDEFRKPSSNGKPTQIGAVKIRDGRIVERFNTFVNPREPLGEWSRNNLKDASGKPLTDEWLSTQPSIADGHRRFVEFAGPDAIVVAQNVVFDKAVLDDALEESGISWRPTGYIDTKELAEMTLPRWTPESEDGPYTIGQDGKRRPSSSLAAITTYLGVELGEGHHTADKDAEATAEVLEKLVTGAIKNNWSRDALDPQLRRDKRDRDRNRFEGDIREFDRQVDEYLEREKNSHLRLGEPMPGKEPRKEREDRTPGFSSGIIKAGSIDEEEARRVSDLVSRRTARAKSDGTTVKMHRNFFSNRRKARNLEKSLLSELDELMERAVDQYVLTRNIPNEEAKRLRQRVKQNSLGYDETDLQDALSPLFTMRETLLSLEGAGDKKDNHLFVARDASGTLTGMAWIRWDPMTDEGRRVIGGMDPAVRDQRFPLGTNDSYLVEYVAAIKPGSPIQAGGGVGSMLFDEILKMAARDKAGIQLIPSSPRSSRYWDDLGFGRTSQSMFRFLEPQAVAELRKRIDEQSAGLSSGQKPKTIRDFDESSLPKYVLEGILAEALRHDSPEKFERAFRRDQMQGVYAHLTSDEDFDVDVERATFVGTGMSDEPSIFLTRDPENWKATFESEIEASGRLTEEEKKKKLASKAKFMAIVTIQGAPARSYTDATVRDGHQIYVGKDGLPHIVVHSVVPYEDGVKIMNNINDGVWDVLTDGEINGGPFKQKLRDLWSYAHQRERNDKSSGLVGLSSGLSNPDGSVDEVEVERVANDIAERIDFARKSGNSTEAIDVSEMTEDEKRQLRDEIFESFSFGQERAFDQFEEDDEDEEFDEEEFFDSEEKMRPIMTAFDMIIKAINDIPNATSIVLARDQRGNVIGVSSIAVTDKDEGQGVKTVPFHAEIRFAGTMNQGNGVGSMMFAESLRSAASQGLPMSLFSLDNSKEYWKSLGFERDSKFPSIFRMNANAVRELDSGLSNRTGLSSGAQLSPEQKVDSDRRMKRVGDLLDEIKQEHKDGEALSAKMLADSETKPVSTWSTAHASPVAEALLPKVNEIGSTLSEEVAVRAIANLGIDLTRVDEAIEALEEIKAKIRQSESTWQSVTTDSRSADEFAKAAKILESMTGIKQEVTTKDLTYPDGATRPATSVGFFGFVAGRPDDFLFPHLNKTINNLISSLEGLRSDPANGFKHFLSLVSEAGKNLSAVPGSQAEKIVGSSRFASTWVNKAQQSAVTDVFEDLGIPVGVPNDMTDKVIVSNGVRVRATERRGVKLKAEDKIQIIEKTVDLLRDALSMIPSSLFRGFAREPNSSRKMELVPRDLVLDVSIEQGRAHAQKDWSTGEIKLKLDPEVLLDEHKDNRWQSTGLHEIGHGLEFTNYLLTQLQAAFIESRIGPSEKIIPIKNMPNGHSGYRDNERGYMDSFNDPYVGKIYVRPTDIKRFNENAKAMKEKPTRVPVAANFEVVTRGLEGIFFPATDVQEWRGESVDKSVIDFTLGALIVASRLGRPSDIKGKSAEIEYAPELQNLSNMQFTNIKKLIGTILNDKFNTVKDPATDQPVLSFKSTSIPATKESISDKQVREYRDLLREQIGSSIADALAEREMQFAGMRSTTPEEIVEFVQSEIEYLRGVMPRFEKALDDNDFDSIEKLIVEITEREWSDDPRKGRALKYVRTNPTRIRTGEEGQTIRKLRAIMDYLEAKASLALDGSDMRVIEIRDKDGKLVDFSYMYKTKVGKKTHVVVPAFGWNHMLFADRATIAVALEAMRHASSENIGLIMQGHESVLEARSDARKKLLGLPRSSRLSWEGLRAGLNRLGLSGDAYFESSGGLKPYNSFKKEHPGEYIKLNQKEILGLIKSIDATQKKRQETA